MKTQLPRDRGHWAHQMEPHQAKDDHWFATYMAREYEATPGLQAIEKRAAKLLKQARQGEECWN